MPAGEPRDVVFTFSYVTWIGAWRRGMNHPEDRLAQTLLDHPRVRRVLIANPYRSMPVYLARSLLGHDSVPFPADDQRKLHQPLRLRRFDPKRLGALRRAYAAYGRGLETAARASGMERPVVIATHPMVAGFAPLDWADAVTYYASDDWSAAPEYREWWPAYEQAYEEIRERERRVCAVSKTIIERIAPSGEHAVIPNGVDPREWQEVESSPAWFLALPRPRMLYVGTLDTRLDVQRIRQAADAFPGGSVVLVGPVTEHAHLQPLRKLHNVRVHPPVSRAEVTKLVTGADVCLIPHARTSFTAAMSPLKAYEYLAGGRSVAATDLPPLRGIDRRLVRAPDGTDFSETVREALELGPASEPERQRFIERNAWRTRHEQVLALAFG